MNMATNANHGVSAACKSEYWPPHRRSFIIAPRVDVDAVRSFATLDCSCMRAGDPLIRRVLTVLETGRTMKAANDPKCGSWCRGLLCTLEFNQLLSTSLNRAISLWRAEPMGSQVNRVRLFSGVGPMTSIAPGSTGHGLACPSKGFTIS